MPRKQPYSDAPHFSMIVKDGTIEIDSIFQFKGGTTEITPFLTACRAYNCTVHFVNEDMTVKPGDNLMMYSMYATIAAYPKILEQYFQYLLKLDAGEIEELAE